MVTRAWAEAYPGATMPTFEPRATQNSVQPPHPDPHSSKQVLLPLLPEPSGGHREGHTKLTGLSQARKRNGGYELMTPKSKAAQESKPERLLVSKMELPQA